jgi:hypothetical protein
VPLKHEKGESTIDLSKEVDKIGLLVQMPSGLPLKEGEKEKRSE